MSDTREKFCPKCRYYAGSFSGPHNMCMIIKCVNCTHVGMVGFLENTGFKDVTPKIEELNHE